MRGRPRTLFCITGKFETRGHVNAITWMCLLALPPFLYPSLPLPPTCLLQLKAEDIGNFSPSDLLIVTTGSQVSGAAWRGAGCSSAAGRACTAQRKPLAGDNAGACSMNCLLHTSERPTAEPRRCLQCAPPASLPTCAAVQRLHSLLRPALPSPPSDLPWHTVLAYRVVHSLVHGVWAMLPAAAVRFRRPPSFTPLQCLALSVASLLVSHLLSLPAHPSAPAIPW